MLNIEERQVIIKYYDKVISKWNLELQSHAKVANDMVVVTIMLLLKQ